MNPLYHAASLLRLNFWHLLVTPTPAADSVFLWSIRVGPVLVLFPADFFVKCRLLQPWFPFQLPSWCVGRTVCNCCMTIANITEVMDIAGSEKSAGGKRMYRSITPLQILALSLYITRIEVVLTRSIQKPPLRSIIWKKSSYSLLLNQSSRAISKLLQKWHML